MVTEVHVDGYDALNELLHSLNPETKLVLYFAGQVNDKGENWCPDCQAGKKLIPNYKHFPITMSHALSLK